MSAASTTTQEAELVARARAGDQAAFAELVAAHADRAYAIALHLVGNRAEAHDVVEDSMVCAWQHLEVFADQSTFTTWLTRIVIDRCQEHRRTTLDPATPHTTCGTELASRRTHEHHLAARRR